MPPANMREFCTPLCPGADLPWRQRHWLHGPDLGGAGSLRSGCLLKDPARALLPPAWLCLGLVRRLTPGPAVKGGSGTSGPALGQGCPRPTDFRQELSPAPLYTWPRYVHGTQPPGGSAGRILPPVRVRGSAEGPQAARKGAAEGAAPLQWALGLCWRAGLPAGHGVMGRPGKAAAEGP